MTNMGSLHHLMEGSMLSVKKRQDKWPVFVTVFIFSLQILGLFLPVLFTIVLALLILYVCGSTAAFQHHHGHCAVFHNKRSNEVLDSIMSLQTGITPYAWVLHHNIGHHGNYMNQYPIKGEEILDASNWTREDGSVMNRWEYVWYNRVRMHERCSEVGQKAQKIFHKYIFFRRINFVLTALFLGLGFAVGSWFGLLSALILFVAIPQFIVLFVFETTYDHHSGLFTENKYEASRNILGSFYNFSRLNLGYHTAHHVKPGLHWSDLPEYHATIQEEIPEELIDNEGSFWSSLVRTIASKPAPSK